MLNWWEGLSLLQRVFITIAVPATLVLLAQSILMFIGFADGGDTDGDFDGDVDGDIDGDFGSDIDLDGDGIPDSLESHIEHGHGEHSTSAHSSGLSLFTVRGVTAFFAVGGWMGVVLAGRNISPVISIPVAFIVGLIALVGLAYIFKGVLMLQETGNVSAENAVGKTAQVYLSIPSNSKGKGKVTLVIQEKYVEFDACTRSDKPIKTGESVHVVDVLDDNVLVVEQTVLNQLPEYTV